MNPLTSQHGRASGFISKSEFAYRELRRRILAERLRPGEQLQLRPLADELGLSVMPVRDALRMLERDGLVTLETHRSATVTDISKEAVLDTISMRMWLEALAVREATKGHTRATLAAVSRELERAEEAMNATDGVGYTHANRKLHEALEATAPGAMKDLIGDLWERLWQTRRRMSLYVLSPDGMPDAQNEHRAIVAAARRGDAEAASAAMAHHREETLRRWHNALATTRE